MSRIDDTPTNDDPLAAAQSAAFKMAMNSGEWPDPMIPGAMHPPEIPASLLPSWVGDMALAVAENTQTPPAMAVMLSLAVLATVVQRRWEVQPYGENDDYSETLSLWVLVALPSGTRKTAVILSLIHICYATANPVIGIKTRRTVKRDRFLQTGELPRFFESLAVESNKTLRDYILLALLTGARRSNLLAMKWSETDLDEFVWRIADTKNRTPQNVTLSPEAVTILTARKETASKGAVFVLSLIHI